MQVTLQTTGGPSAGTKIIVQSGQIAHVGRTKWADYSFPADAVMSDVHFAVEYDGPQCCVRDLKSGRGTLVNGVAVGKAALHSGDQITAGGTVFSVLVDGEPLPAVEAPADTSATATPSDSPPGPKTAADICRNLDMSEPAQKLLSEGLAPVVYLNLLAAAKLFPDALRFLAAWLPTPVAVAWGCRCVQDVFGTALQPQEQASLTAAENWVADPSEKHRRAAQSAADANRLRHAASWVAMGAFWSGGSIAPPNLPDVPPPEGMLAQAITAALLMAAPHGDPSQAGDRYRMFLEQGTKLANDQPQDKGGA